MKNRFYFGTLYIKNFGRPTDKINYNYKVILKMEHVISYTYDVTAMIAIL